MKISLQTENILKVSNIVFLLPPYSFVDILFNSILEV